MFLCRIFDRNELIFQSIVKANINVKAHIEEKAHIKEKAHIEEKPGFLIF